jgi:hypothetical protein
VKSCWLAGWFSSGSSRMTRRSNFSMPLM